MLNFQVLSFFLVTIFATRLEITEVLLTKLLNSNTRQYAATFKTIETVLLFSC